MRIPGVDVPVGVDVDEFIGGPRGIIWDVCSKKDYYVDDIIED